MFYRCRSCDRKSPFCRSHAKNKNTKTLTSRRWTRAKMNSWSRETTSIATYLDRTRCSTRNSRGYTAGLPTWRTWTTGWRPLYRILKIKTRSQRRGAGRHLKTWRLLRILIERLVIICSTFPFFTYSYAFGFLSIFISFSKSGNSFGLWTDWRRSWVEHLNSNMHYNMSALGIRCFIR